MAHFAWTTGLCTHFTFNIEDGTGLNNQFVSGNITFNFSGFLDMQYIADDEHAFKSAFDHCIFAGDITGDIPGRANDHFAFAMKGIL